MKTTLIILLLTAAACCVRAGQLTEESVRQFLEHRDKTIVANDRDAIAALFETNAVLAISGSTFEGMDYKVSLVHYMGMFGEKSKQEYIDYKTMPRRITVADDEQVAEVESVTEETTRSVTRKRIMHSADSESIQIALVDGIPKIRKLKQVRIRKTLEKDELAKRCLTLAESEESITREQAVELLEETGGQLREQEVDGRKLLHVRSPIYDPFGDEFPAIGSCIPGITKLSMGSRSCVTDAGLPYIARMNSLQGLDLMGAGITDAGIAQLTGLNNLKQLMLVGTVITDDGLEHITRIQSLENLFLGGNYTDAGLIHLANLPDLKQVTLFSPRITDEGISILSNLENLEMVSVSSAPITDTALEHLAKLKKLKTLKLQGSRISHAAITRFQKEHPEINVGPAALMDPCKDSRHRIDYAKRRWAKKENASPRAQPSGADLVPYIFSDGFFSDPLPSSIDALKCQEGGVFSINSMDQSASCSIHGTEKPPRRAPPMEGLSKEDFDVDGAKIGRWTMDLEAAQKRAAEKQLPLLMNFTGSDWCYWCKLMEKNVFTQPEWSAYATNHIVMVLIDFPRNKTAVPEKYKERNNVLKEQYGIRSYPTFILLKPDGITELARLKAGRDKTPAGFIKEVKAQLQTAEGGEK